MPIMTLNHLDKAFGPQVVLDNVCLSIGRGVRIGLIGRNGDSLPPIRKICILTLQRTYNPHYS